MIEDALTEKLGFFLCKIIYSVVIVDMFQPK